MCPSKEIKTPENNPIGKGRPKGAKNKTTLFKEAMKEGFETLLEKEGKKVFEAVVEKAKDGDMTAAKLILDRIIPVADVVGKTSSGTTQVVINVSGMEATIDVADGSEIVDADFEEIEE